LRKEKDGSREARECFFAKRFVSPEMHFFGSNTFFECPNFQLILLSGESLTLISSKVYVICFLNFALVWMISMPIIFFIVCELQIDYIVSNIYGLNIIHIAF